jgi:flavin reductase (DIM6/NTAB) family NADH-FMN oxidoreductase RutF
MSGIGADDLRRLMGHWATGVSVLTSNCQGGPRGATANAVVSLSLAPPLMLACFHEGSQTLAAVRESRRFAINVLGAGQEPISHRFATKDPLKFEGVRYRAVEGAPVLEEALAWLVCRVTEELLGGDHVAVIGAPLAGAAKEEGEPLVFFRSRYRTLVLDG